MSPCSCCTIEKCLLFFRFAYLSCRRQWLPMHEQPYSVTLYCRFTFWWLCQSEEALKKTLKYFHLAMFIKGLMSTHTYYSCPKHFSGLFGKKDLCLGPADVCSLQHCFPRMKATHLYFLILLTSSTTQCLFFGNYPLFPAEKQCQVLYFRSPRMTDQVRFIRYMGGGCSKSSKRTKTVM